MIRCACVSSFMGPYISNYLISELALQQKFMENGDYLIHIFPKEVEDKDWVNLFKNIGAKVYFIKYKPHTLWTILTFRKIFRKEKINILHCHFGGWDIDAKLAAPFIPTIWHQRMSVNLNTKKRRLYHCIMYKMISKWNTHHIAISESGFEAITSLTSSRCDLIYNGIDFSRLKKKESFYKGMPSDRPVKVLMFAFSAIGKGLDIAIPACQSLIDKGISLSLNVVTQADSNQYLDRYYPVIPEWLHIMPPTSNIFTYYNNNDIFLSASRSEGFCNSLLEAIFCGLPCVESDIPGTQWAINYHNVFQYPVESVSKLSEALLECIDTPLRPTDVAENQKKAQSQFSMDKWAKRVYTLLAEYHK